MTKQRGDGAIFFILLLFLLFLNEKYIDLPTEFKLIKKGQHFWFGGSNTFFFNKFDYLV
jgi:hypothetical protein